MTHMLDMLQTQQRLNIRPQAQHPLVRLARSPRTKGERRLANRQELKLEAIGRVERGIAHLVGRIEKSHNAVGQRVSERLCMEEANL